MKEPEHCVPVTHWAYVIRWAGGFALASLLAWGLSYVFSNSILPLVYDVEIGAERPVIGHVHRHHSEGWGETHFGRYGVSAIEDIRTIEGPTVAIWGDSYVEAFQVDDKDKLAQQVTARCSTASGERITGVGIGQSGRTASDYTFLIPRYEALFSPSVHIILIAQIDDVLPDGRHFRAEPFRVEEVLFPVSWRSLRPILGRFELLSLWTAARNILNGPEGTRQIRFRPGPQPTTPSEAIPDASTPQLETDAIDFLLSSMTPQTERPITFVYAPPTPRIEDGRVRMDDPNAATAKRFEAACARHGVGFIDMRPAFERVYIETGAFPRGFSNSVPSRGHFNPLGHRLVADAICHHLKEPADVVHAD